MNVRIRKVVMVLKLRIKISAHNNNSRKAQIMKRLITGMYCTLL